MKETGWNQVKNETLGKVFSSFVEANQTLIFIFADRQGKILDCNRSFSNQVNEEPQETIGKDLCDYLVGCDELHNMTLIQDLVSNKKPFKIYLHVSGKNGLPRTYHFHFFYADGFVFALGEPEVESLEHTSKALMEINNEMLNLHRNKQ